MLPASPQCMEALLSSALGAIIIVLCSIYDTDASTEDSPRSTPGPRNGGRGAKRRQRQ
jgi:hypothetical protein